MGNLDDFPGLLSRLCLDSQRGSLYFPIPWLPSGTGRVNSEQHEGMAGSCTWMGRAQGSLKIEPGKGGGGGRGAGQGGPDQSLNSVSLPCRDLHWTSGYRDQQDGVPGSTGSQAGWSDT